MIEAYFTEIKSLLLVSLMALTSSCATSGHKSQQWEALKASADFQKEKEIYKQRVGGSDFCWGIALEDFSADPNVKPTQKCLYPPYKMFVEDDGFISKHNVLKRGLNRLKVLQVTADGFLLVNAVRSNGQPIFIHKTNESGLVDGSYLDDSYLWQLYEHSGPYTYQSLAGPKTVNSFTKVASERFDKAKLGLSSYAPLKEFYIENELWDSLDEPKN